MFFLQKIKNIYCTKHLKIQTVSKDGIEHQNKESGSCFGAAASLPHKENAI